MSPAENEHHHRFLRAFTANEPAIRAYVRRLVPARADADDIMQDVSVVLWEKFGSFREGGDFRAWAFGVARFEVLGWLRDRGRDRLVLDEEVVLKLAEETKEDEPTLARQRQALDDCMSKVPTEQRELLMRAYQPEAQIQEVALESGRTVPGFYQWLHRVRRMLQDCILRALSRETSS
jgi:RNA polymerase sigma-70 factor (ECF subfamily)